MFINDLKEMETTLNIAFSVYVASMGDSKWLAVEGQVYTTRQDAIAYNETFSERHPIIWSEVLEITGEGQADLARQQMIEQLRQEKENVRKRMLRDLEKYDERINTLLAITHQTEDDDKPF